MLLYAFYTIHVLICIFLILVVLLQQGSGADLSVFGGGATQTAFGARSATSLLHRLTVAAFVGFILTTMAIGFIKMGGPSGSVMSDVPIEEEAPAETSGQAEAAAEEETGSPDLEPLVDELEPADAGAGEAAPEADVGESTDADEGG